jgi:parallel beta-helix repeat protein
MITSSSIIIVDNEGDGDYRTIVDALEIAEPGDHIQIYSGMYNETLNVTINNLTIEGIDHELGSGKDQDYPTINGQMNGPVLTLNAAGCQISGLILTNSGDTIFDAGLVIYQDENIIQGNGIGGNHYGILINNCSEITIKGNYIVGNRMDGIFLGYTWDNTIEENIIKENGFQGLFLLEVTDTLIQKNTIYLNDRDGIHLRSLCTRNSIQDNDIYSNGIDGIKIWHEDVWGNLIKKNKINGNKWNGIHLMDGYDNTCSENSITLNFNNGIHLGSAYENYVIRNNLSENKNHGIECLLHDCQHNKFYYNNINDGVVDYGSNQWDDGIGNGGNYWSYYTGDDDDDDGIGDTPQPIEGNENKDFYPFIEPFTPPAVPNIPMGQLILL